jgi:hypothetical protein
MPDAGPGDMPMISFEPVLPLRVFMPVAESGAVVVELENVGLVPSEALDLLVRIRLFRA